MDIVKLSSAGLPSPACLGLPSHAVTCPSSSDRLVVMIHITDAIAIEEREVEESFVRAGGPGGQNVNQIATAVQLRFDVRRSPSLPDDVRGRNHRGCRILNVVMDIVQLSGAGLSSPACLGLPSPCSDVSGVVR